MTREELLWLHAQPEYVDTFERYMQESDTLAEMLADMAWVPSTPEQQARVKQQADKRREALILVSAMRSRLLEFRKHRRKDG